MICVHVVSNVPLLSFDDLPETLHEDVRKSAEELMKQLQPQLKENLQVRDALYTLSVCEGERRDIALPAAVSV